MRKKLPATLEKKILVKNRHCCCICQRDGIGQDVNTHHIDGNHNHNVESNLAVLCLIHASQADAGLKKGKLGSGKKLKPGEVKEYKKIWERKIDLENKHKKQIIPLYRKKHLEALFYFEIRKTANEIVSLNDTDKRIKDKFNYLDQFYFEEVFTDINLRKILLEAYSDMAIQTFERTELPKKICSSLENLFLHLVGPEDVSIGPQDKMLISKSIEVLETLGDFAAEFNKNSSVLQKVCATIYNFGEISTWYKLKQQKTKIYKVLNKIKNFSLHYEDEKKPASEVKKEQKKRQTMVDRYYNKLKRLR